MYIVTGGAGFIGSCFVSRLNEAGVDDIVLVDSIGESEKWRNLRGKRFREYLHKDAFLDALEQRKFGIPEAVIHLGASSSTTVIDGEYLLRNNVQFTQRIAKYCAAQGVRFIYASSAATYGAGENGFDDQFGPLEKLTPLNRYGFSKHLVDCWMTRYLPKVGAGLKFFNVYGPNEYHKGSQRSVAYHGFHQLHSTGSMKLFKSYRPDYGDGEQRRDFIYVKDCTEVLWWLCQHPNITGLFNVGTGNARTWNDLANALCDALNIPRSIAYIPMPENLIGQYQYFTEAKMDSLRNAGFSKPFTSLEEGIKEYVQSYLLKDEAFY